MPEGNNQTTNSKAIVSLQSILKNELSRDVSYEEALEIGESLIDFYELLSLEGELNE